ncbi:AraC-like DNA-binding protein [Kordia periserrulae]|uniref:AraC-like DNA-binding protein n=2 Tax=Kordia periserrulae TaxID=701523 RepID=A0A2T6C2Z4_9FLAO|nr:AraC-like DNA-binding protein [Kordia periserrulae]
MHLFKTNFIVFLLCICCLLCNCSQEEKKTETIIVDELLDVIKKNVNKDFEKAIMYSDQLISYALSKNDSLTVARAHLQKGIALTKKGNYQTAIDTLEKGLTFIKNKEVPEKNLFLLRIGNAYVLDEKNDEALVYYSRVYEDALLNNKKLDLVKAAINISKIKRNVGNHREALEDYKSFYKQSVSLNMEKTVIARTLLGICGTYLTLQQPDSALHYGQKGYKISKEIEDEVGVSYFHVDFGIAYYLKDNYTTSLSYLNKAKNYLENIKNPKRLAETLFYIGACQYRLKNYEQAITYLKEVLLVASQSEKVGNIEFKPLQLIDTYDFLSKSYIALGDAEQSRFYENERNNTEKVTDKKNNKINTKLLKNELQISEKVIANIRQTSNRYKLFLMLAGIVCMLSISLVIYYRKKAKTNRRTFEKLMQQQETEPSKPKPITIDDEKVALVLKKLHKIEAQAYYLDSNCSLANLAKKAKTNPTYLTKILKEAKGKTFYQYINELRINYAIERLKSDHQFRKYAIKHIALEVGYKSPESFTKHFKKATGINPSYYIKELEKHLQT